MASKLLYLIMDWETFNFHDRSPYHIETSPLICSGNQWTCFCLIGTNVVKELIVITCDRTGQRCNESHLNIHNGTSDKNSWQH